MEQKERKPKDETRNPNEPNWHFPAYRKILLPLLKPIIRGYEAVVYVRGTLILVSSSRSAVWRVTDQHESFHGSLIKWYPRLAERSPLRRRVSLIQLWYTLHKPANEGETWASTPPSALHAVYIINLFCHSDVLYCAMETMKNKINKTNVSPIHFQYHDAGDENELNMMRIWG